MASQERQEPSQEKFIEDALGAFISQAGLEHKLPWRIEADWAYEVYDADGRLVVKCRTKELAEWIIELVVSREGELLAFEAEAEAEMAALDGKPGSFQGLEERRYHEDRERRLSNGDNPDDLSDPENR